MKSSFKKTLLLVAFVLLATQFLQAQFFRKNFYYEGEIGYITSFFVEDADGKTHIVTLGGLNFRGGVGVHDEDDIIFIGLHSGMDGNFRHHTGILPVYLNSRIGIPVTETAEFTFRSVTVKVIK